MFNQSISIVFPVYNEEKNILAMVDKCLKYLSSNFRNYEIIIVDDGSIDSTGSIIDRLADTHKGVVRVLHHHPNQGYGAALRSGFSNCRSDLIFYTDGDNQFDVTEINDFMPFVDSYDILLGYRFPRRDPFFRLVISKGYNLFASSMFNLRVHDINSSFKIFHRDILSQISITSNEFFVDAEIIAKARYHKFSIFEMPVKHFPRLEGNTTVNFRHVVSTLKEMFSVFKELRLKKC